MNFVEEMKKKAAALQKKLVLPEGNEERTIQAAAQIMKENIAKEVILLGKPEEIKATADAKGIDISAITLIDPEASEWNADFAKEYYEYEI